MEQPADRSEATAPPAGAPAENAQAGAVQEVTAAVLIIGNEILSGRTKDANLGWLAERLYALGIRMREARVVSDVEADILAAVDALRQRYDYVFTTGGIGPTHDDITSACIAKAFGVPLERNAEAVRRLERHYAPGQLNEARLRMADIPRGATLVDNPVSGAPGFQIGNVVVLAGVPAIMQAMFDGLKTGLVGGAPLFAKTVRCLVPEGILAEGLGRIQGRYAQVEIGSYPFFRNQQFGVSLVLRSTDPDALGRATAEVAELVTRLGGAPAIEDGQG
ncbi:MAG TPA: molybdopterin-binding protein [Azospirillaceae bacterium]|nr:molybdopterin-binding protein [Azospirillaceae bacterium]